MSRYVVIVKEIQVIGKLWSGPIAAMTYSLSLSDVYNISCMEKLNRRDVEKWLITHSGDFQHIIDFHADIDEFDSPWNSEESEIIFNSCTYSEPEDN